MASEILASQKQNAGLSFDPRTKMAGLITMVLLVLGGSFQTEMFYIPAIAPLIIFLLSKIWKGAAIYFIVYGASIYLQEFWLVSIPGIARYLVMIVVGLLLYFGPSIAMAYYVVTTTTVSEFIAGMERLHMPNQITIPMAVMFRFFPTVMEEWNSIGDAMKMRGIRLCGGKAGSILEYRLVPMLMCSVKIGEELSAASLTRGLGGPVKRTNICNIGIHLQDIFMLLLCAAGLVAQIVLWIRG